MQDSDEQATLEPLSTNNEPAAVLMSLPQRGSGRLSPRNTVRTMRAAWLRLQRSWRPVRDMDPEFWRKLGAELSSVRPWIDRGIVLAYAALTGLIVVGFTLLAEAATHGFAALTQASVYAKYISLLWTPALTVVLRDGQLVSDQPA